MSGGLRRYEFSEKLAEMLGESRRDLRFRVTMMVSAGVVKPGPRGRGSPLATPAYGSNLLVGAMAAPQQVHTIEAIRCYWELEPAAIASEMTTPGIILGLSTEHTKIDISTTLPIPFTRLRFGECLTQLLELASSKSTCGGLASELFGIWVSRGYPVAGLQIGVWSKGRRSVITQRFELSEGERPPSWLDPSRNGIADPGLLHTVFLPASKLIEIGMLTTSEKKKNPMLNLGPKIAKFTDLVNLVRQGRYRIQWEKLLLTLIEVQTWANKVGTQDSRLVEITDFGSNPGNLRMFTYVPGHLLPAAPLVVALHGCTQTAAAYDLGTGWSELADRFGFALLLPQQHWTNNPLRCFNWFRPEDTVRDSGEPSSIRQMIEWMSVNHDLDRRCVYVTGLSSGAAMTSVMLAAYPDVFAGGAIVSGVPYHSANGLQEAFESIFMGVCRSGSDWGDRIRAASSHQGPWPGVSVWHGDEDTSVAPVNAEESIKQWADVHGLPLNPSIENEIDGYPHRVWQGPRGENLLESYTIVGMSHGQPLDMSGGEYSCGTVGPFFNDVGISSTYRIAEFWNLPETLSKRQSRTKSQEVTIMGQTGERTFNVVPVLNPTPSDTNTSSEQTNIVEEVSADSAGVEGGNPKSGGIPLGIDVQKIITKSFEMAGLLKQSEDNPTGSGSVGKSAPLGIDIQGIISESLKAAGVLAESSSKTPPSESLSPETGQVGESVWQGEGWELISNRSGRAQGEPLLFGYASSGNDCEVGNKIRSISREVSLGDHPTLSYIRRLKLNAAANDHTRARFSVLVDDLAVDEVSAVGMEHTEGEWMQRSGIDLTPFANRTVKLTFQVAAHSNVCNEVFAKAWVDRIHVRDVS
uniref:Esterase, PHB depolymerase family n=1 Tax=Candidatus Kentrum eta TaxID=2126337 RepID=A0A450V291_9GAMM|nr:MAG: esterase, PHB depolymerase family [Candidatus Kentron sp. H]VFJ92238.1 MAG: esterase, PHB depolymerase family [Candidatus Kentron sp. H]VFJ98912.1 MAG: esterase, PHB depolymerase family [Candidatus Kentron sp. H]